MTNKEYLANLSDEIFDVKNKTVEELIKNETYCNFEKDIQESIEEDFARIGCDTSNGMPTNLGMDLWMHAKASEKLINKFEQKYRKGSEEL